MTTVRDSRGEDLHPEPVDPVINTLMTSRVIAVLPGATLVDALQVMSSAGVKHLPVMEDDRCVGLLAEIDMLRELITQELLRPGLTARLTVGEVCRRPAPVVPVWSTRAATAGVMVALGSDVVLVLDGACVVGIVTATDLVASLSRPVLPAEPHGG